MNIYRQVVGFLLLAFSLGLSASEQLGPDKRIEQATAQLLVVIQEGKGYYADDPERFYKAVEQVIDPLFDFQNFTRRVMGPFGQRDYYLSLDKNQRKQYKKDYYRFVKRFKKGLIATYSKGMLAFSGQAITVQPLSDDAKKAVAYGELVTVEQHIQGEDKTYKALYSMTQNKKGNWLVRNVIIESVNIGSLYRSQFLAAMKAENNNFAKVVDTWVVDSQDLQKATSEEK